MLTIAQKRARFAELHEGSGCFVIPNPWDVGSTKYLASLGFKALATTSAGAAFAAGLPDGGMTRKAVLAHIAELVAATDLPFNADYEAGFAATLEELHDSVARCIGAGVAGFSIEDYTGDAPRRSMAFRRRPSGSAPPARRSTPPASGCCSPRAAKRCCAAIPTGSNEALRRLSAYARGGRRRALRAGPAQRRGGRRGRARRRATAGQCAGASRRGSPSGQLEDLGVRRVSVGGSLARAAWGGFMNAAQDIAQHGRFDSLAHGRAVRRTQQVVRQERGLTGADGEGAEIAGDAPPRARRGARQCRLA